MKNKVLCFLSILVIATMMIFISGCQKEDLPPEPNAPGVSPVGHATAATSAGGYVPAGDKLAISPDEETDSIIVTVPQGSMDYTYKYGYYVLKGDTSWTRFDFQGSNIGNWMRTKQNDATATISDVLLTSENYFIAYGCTKEIVGNSLTWDCNNGNWLLAALVYPDLEVKEVKWNEKQGGKIFVSDNQIEFNITLNNSGSLKIDETGNSQLLTVTYCPIGMDDEEALLQCYEIGQLEIKNLILEPGKSNYSEIIIPNLYVNAITDAAGEYPIFVEVEPISGELDISNNYKDVLLQVTEELPGTESEPGSEPELPSLPGDCAEAGGLMKPEVNTQYKSCCAVGLTPLPYLVINPATGACEQPTEAQLLNQITGNSVLDVIPGTPGDVGGDTGGTATVVSQDPVIDLPPGIYICIRQDGVCDPAIGENKCTNPAECAQCADSDVTTTYPDGKNPILKGTVLINGVERIDICRDGTTLTEYYCDADEELATETIACSSDYWAGCQNGACRKCYDSDGGTDITKQGTTVGKLSLTSVGPSTRTDSCASLDKAVKYYCREDNLVRLVQVSCGTGKHCDHGICVTTTP